MGVFSLDDEALDGRASQFHIVAVRPLDFQTKRLMYMI